MKKKRILTALIAITFSIAIQKAHSQAAILALIFGDQVASEEFNLSLELGFNFSTISNFTDIDKTNATNFGLGCNFKLSEQLYLSPSVFFLSKRKLDFSSFSLNTGNTTLDNEFINKSGNANLSYIDVPVLFWYELDKIRIGVGPQISFLTNSNLFFNGDDGDFKQDIKSDTNSIDYGVMASLGYALGKARKGKGLYVQARYYHGFEDVYNNNVSTGSNKASYFAIHFSLPFITEELAKKNL
tara:strand:- start:159 stop:884 length:726 start_codon:yes stop_codon:yes gene_type:complete